MKSRARRQATGQTRLGVCRWTENCTNEHRVSRQRKRRPARRRALQNAALEGRPICRPCRSSRNEAGPPEDGIGGPTSVSAAGVSGVRSDYTWIMCAQTGGMLRDGNISPLKTAAKITLFPAKTPSDGPHGGGPSRMRPWRADPHAAHAGVRVMRRALQNAALEGRPPCRPQALADRYLFIAASIWRASVRASRGRRGSRPSRCGQQQVTRCFPPRREDAKFEKGTWRLSASSRAPRQSPSA